MYFPFNKLSVVCVYCAFNDLFVCTVPLTAACERSNAALVAVLLNRGVLVNTACNQGWTALQEAACRNNVEVCEMLLKAGAKHSQTNIYGITPMFTAAQSGQLAALRLLFKHGTWTNELMNT